jgi:hypothetical protein
MQRARPANAGRACNEVWLASCADAAAVPYGATSELLAREKTLVIEPPSVDMIVIATIEISNS